MFCQIILQLYKIPSSDYALGMSRLFLKAGRLALIEKFMAAGAGEGAEELKRELKALMRRKKLRRVLHAVRISLYLKRAAKSTRTGSIGAALVRSARTYVKLARWHKKARRKFTLPSVASKISSTARILSKMNAWVAIGKQNVVAKKNYEREILMRGVFKHLWWGVIYDEKLQKNVLSEWRIA